MFFADNYDMKASKDIFSFFKCVSLCFIVSGVFCFGLYADSSYIVKKGDTLYSISKKYEITVPELRAANNLGENDVLKTGVKLIIPSADISNAAALSEDKGASGKNNAQSEKKIGTANIKTSEYIVEKGDTLYGIARKNNIKLTELLALNNIDNSATIKVGQKLLVPVNTLGKPQEDISTSSSSKSEKAVVTKSDSSASQGKIINATGVTWPLENPTVRNVNGKVWGVQLTGKDGESVRVVREGTVMYTGVYRGFGEVVFVQSQAGLIYSYTGLGNVTTKKGDYVSLGDEIGKTARSGDSSIKFMVFQNGMPIDPLKAPRG